jgi:hypothetical protein
MDTKTRLLTCLMSFAATAAVAADDAALRACRGVPDLAARAACYDAIPLPAVAATDAESRFGASQLVVPARDELQAISSVIKGRFDGWDADTRLTLANGQVWAIADGSRGAYRLTDPKVLITRGMLGSFFIEIEGAARTPRVRRLQ